MNRDVDWLAFEDVDDYGVAAELALGLRSPDLGEVAVDALDLSVDDDDVFEFAQVDLSVLVGFLLDAFFEAEDLVGEGEVDEGVFEGFAVFA